MDRQGDQHRVGRDRVAAVRAGVAVMLGDPREALSARCMHLLVGLLWEEDVFHEQHEDEGETREGERRRVGVAESDPGPVRVGQHVDEARREEHAGGEGVAPAEQSVASRGIPKPQGEGGAAAPATRIAINSASLIPITGNSS